MKRKENIHIIKIYSNRERRQCRKWDHVKLTGTVMRIGNLLSIDFGDDPVDMADRDRQFSADRFE